MLRSAVLWALPMLVGLGCARQRPESPPPSVPDPDWMSVTVPPMAPFPGTTGLSAASCGSCHQEIYTEWSASTHAHAWVDRQFQAELHKDEAVAWLCINCHTPLAAQQVQLTTSTGNIRSPQRVDNPNFDAELQAEGITCLTCHWRPEGIAAVHEDAVAPHPLVYAPELRSETTCTGCHQAVARLEDALVCTFNTGQEWADAAPGRTCPECHMPSVSRASAVGAPERKGGQHLWPGSLIPKDAWSDAEAALFKDWVPGADLTVVVPDVGDVGEPVTIRVQLTNARAGHMLPTGDPERYLELRTLVESVDGDVLISEEHRVGQRWEWYPVARKVDDNRLAPGETRAWEHRFTLPEGGAALRVELDHVRISPENTGHHDLGDYPTRRRVKSEARQIRPRGPTSAPAP